MQGTIPALGAHVGRITLLAFALCCCAACDDSMLARDGGAPTGDASSSDASAPDASISLDAGSSDSGGGASSDAGDAGERIDGAADAACASVDCVSAPRPGAPLSTSTVSSQRPTLRWVVPGGATAVLVELCVERACTAPVMSELVVGPSTRPLAPIAPGVYFWRLRSMVGVAAGAVGPVWQFRVGARDTGVDTSWGASADVDGDGDTDVLVGAQAEDAVYVFRGAPGGPETTPSQRLSVTRTSVGWGAAIASAGDLNGDGFADVAVGEVDRQQFTWAGSSPIYVFHGGADGLSETPVEVGSVRLVSRFGESIASAGDVDGDGYADLVVGAREDTGPPTPHRGAAYVFRGGPGGIAATPATALYGGEDLSGFGRSVAGGDVNGDGFGDIVVCRDADAFVYHGGPGGLSTSAAAHLGLVAFVVGPVASMADVDGDGYADVVATGSRSRAATTVVFRGGPGGVSEVPSTIITHGPTDGDSALPTNRSVGDLDGDGYGDAAFGFPFANETNGLVFLHHGGPSGLDEAPARTFAPDRGGAYVFFGLALSAGHIDGDELADLYVGPGSVLVYAGTTSGVSTTATNTIPGPAGSSGFGASLE